WQERGRMYTELHQYDKALANVNKAIGLDPKLALPWNNRGHTYIEMRQYDKALADLNKAMELDPRNAWPWHDRARIYTKLHQYDKALAAANKCIEVDPTRDPLHRDYLAWHLATCPDAKFRDASKAVALAKQAVELAPKEREFWNTLGAAHYRAGNW